MPAKLLWDAGDPSAPAWSALDDRVMGGLSRSSLVVVDGLGVFSGTLSRANGGGFCSVRSQPGHFDARDCAGLALRVRGDGKHYRLRLRMDTSFDGVSHEAGFETRAAEWLEPRLPFAAFRARFRGHDVPHAPPLEPARIATLGLMLADEQAGPFRLELAWIAVFGV